MQVIDNTKENRSFFSFSIVHAPTASVQAIVVQPFTAYAASASIAATVRMVTVAETHIGHILHIGNGFIDVYHYRLELYIPEFGIRKSL